MKLVIDLDKTLCIHEQDTKFKDLGSYIIDVRDGDVREEILPLLNFFDEIHIVTARAEILRDITEEWLSKYNIEYDKLHLFPLDSLEEWFTCSAEEMFEWKANVIDGIEPDVVIDDHDGIDRIKNLSTSKDILFLKVI